MKFGDLYFTVCEAFPNQLYMFIKSGVIYEHFYNIAPDFRRYGGDTANKILLLEMNEVEFTGRNIFDYE